MVKKFMKLESFEMAIVTGRLTCAAQFRQSACSRLLYVLMLYLFSILIIFAFFLYQILPE